MDEYIGPEAGTIPSDSPTLVIALSFSLGLGKIAFRSARFYVPGVVNPRTRFAKDRLRPVSLQPLCPGVPTDDVPTRIQLVNGILPHAFDQQSESLFAVEEIFSRVFSVGHFV